MRQIRTERRIHGRACRRIRELQHKTQSDIATAAVDEQGNPLSFTTVAHIEAGRRQPSLDVMCRMANGLGVHLDDITYSVNVYVADDGQSAA